MAIYLCFFGLVSAQTEGNTYPLKRYAANEPLMKTEIDIILMSLGVSVMRYAYEIPDFHSICYSHEYYIEGQKQERLGPDGKPMDWPSGGIAGTTGGENIISLIFRRTDDILNIWNARKSGGGTLGRVNIEGYYHVGDVRYGESLAVGKKSLVHAWLGVQKSLVDAWIDVRASGGIAAAPARVGILPPGRPVEEIASEYGLVVAIYAELECSKAEEARRRIDEKMLKRRGKLPKRR